MHDIVIIGAGPAGLTAAIYARRAGKSVLVLEKETFGGQITYSPKVENYPGFGALSGSELGEKLVEQALNFDVEIELDEVIAIRDMGGRNVKAVRGMLDLEALRGSKDRSTDIKNALDQLAK